MLFVGDYELLTF